MRKHDSLADVIWWNSIFWAWYMPANAKWSWATKCLRYPIPEASDKKWAIKLVRLSIIRYLYHSFARKAVKDLITNGWFSWRNQPSESIYCTRTACILVVTFLTFLFLIASISSCSVALAYWSVSTDGLELNSLRTTTLLSHGYKNINCVLLTGERMAELFSFISALNRMVDWYAWDPTSRNTADSVRCTFTHMSLTWKGNGMIFIPCRCIHRLSFVPDDLPQKNYVIMFSNQKLCSIIHDCRHSDWCCTDQETNNESFRLQGFFILHSVELKALISRDWNWLSIPFIFASDKRNWTPPRCTRHRCKQNSQIIHASLVQHVLVGQRYSHVERNTEAIEQSEVGV